MRIPLRVGAPLAFLLGLAMVLAPGCSEDSSLAPNQPPQTYLFVEGESGEFDATHYTQILSWHGEDSDGEVLRFEYKWTLAEGVDPGGFDTTWVGLVEPYVVESRDTFFLPVPALWSDTLSHRFEIRAVDDEGAADLSPSVAHFPVFNQAPRLVGVVGENDTIPALSLPDSTLPVVSIRFRVYDPDNLSDDHEVASALIKEIRFWFDDEGPENATTVPGSDTLLVLFPEDFGDRVGVSRGLNLQAVDRGGALSNVLADSSFIRDVSLARVLILDSAQALTPENLNTVDPFWRDQVRHLFQPEETYLHTFRPGNGLGHPDILHLIFSLFQAVLWYNGSDGAAAGNYSSEPTPEISQAEPGIRWYLEDGGKVLLTGFNLVGASVGPVSGGSLSAEFEEEVLLSDSLFVHSTGTPEGVATSNWRIWLPPPFETPIAGSEEAGTDTLINATSKIGVDRMSLSPGALNAGHIEDLYRLSGENVFPPSLFDGSVGVRRHFPSGGDLVLLTFPISLAGGRGNHIDQVRYFLEEFGVLP